MTDDPLERVHSIQRGLWIHAMGGRPPTGQTPHAVVHRHDKLTVRHYAPPGATPIPVVVVPSLINRATICDLEPDRSLVGALVASGHAVYLLDWGSASDEDADEDLTYVILTLLHRSIGRVLRHAGATAVHLFGYCMGGTMAAMYAASRPAAVASLCTLAAPVRFSEGGGFRDLVMDLDVDAVFPPGSLVTPEIMRPAFQLLDPVGALTKFAALDAAALDPVGLRRALARERWLEENVALSSAVVREFVRLGYQQDCLLSGGWILGGAPIDLCRIRCPTLVFACERDIVAPRGAVVPLAEVVPGARLEVLPTGHIGAVVGSAGPRVFYPLLHRWFSEVSP